MKISDLAVYCAYCHENIATKTRSVPIRRKNGYKLMDIEPAVAKVSLNLMAGESLATLSPSLQSSVPSIPRSVYSQLADASSATVRERYR